MPWAFSFLFVCPFHAFVFVFVFFYAISSCFRAYIVPFLSSFAAACIDICTEGTRGLFIFPLPVRCMSVDLISALAGAKDKLAFARLVYMC